MIVVSDTSAITSLLQIGRVELLAKLYEEVVIPEAVECELRHDHLTLPEFIRVDRAKNVLLIQRLTLELDRGEAEAIALMVEHRGDVLLIDERRGRRVAEREGVPVIGLLGVLTKAKRADLIASLSDTVNDLQRLAGFRVSDRLKARLRVESGE